MLDMLERLAAILQETFNRRVYLMASKVHVFALSALPLVNEPLPLLSHFGPKCFEAGIGC